MDSMWNLSVNQPTHRQDVWRKNVKFCNVCELPVVTKSESSDEEMNTGKAEYCSWIGLSSVAYLSTSGHLFVNVDVYNDDVN